MFGSSSNPFGQSSNSPFGSQSVFGQTNNANTNPFAPKPFGSTTPFGSQTGSSIFGGTSTGVFGATQASPTLATTPTFGASSSPGFGNTTPTFGSTPSTFGSSAFGQKPSFGGFGSTPSQSSPFGSSFQQTQPAFGSNAFGSTTPFGGSSQPAFGATSSTAFGASTTPTFGASPTPAFGATTSAFGSTPTPAFGSNQTPAFGSNQNTAFGATSTPTFGAGGAFGASSTSAFGASSSPSFGTSTASAFGASSTPSFSFGTTSAFGQSTSAFGSSPFGATPSPFGAQSSAFGATSTTPAFGSPNFGQSTSGGQRGGSRVAAYAPTPEVDGSTGQQTAGKLESISAMSAYKDKSHEELRWEDYQLGDKGGPNPTQAAAATGFGAPSGQSNPFGSTPTFGQSASNPFSSSTGSSLFGSKPSTFGTTGFGAPPSSSPFGASTSTTNPFGATSSPTTSLFNAPPATSAFGGSSSPSPFGSTTSAFGSSPSIFGTGSSPSTTSAFGSGLNFGNTQSAGLFQSTTPSFAQTNTGFGATSTFGQNTNPPFGQSNQFTAPSTGFGGNLFSSTPSLFTSNNPVGFGQTTASSSSPFQPAQPAQTAGSFSFGNFQQPQGGGFGTPSIFSQSTSGQSSANQSSLAVQQAPPTNPFGNLPAMPQVSFARAGSAPSIQYGISSMPVADKPAPVRVSSLLTSRHLSQRRIRLPARKYHPKSDGQRVPFYCDDDEAPSTPKADALFIPRENPRALIIRPSDQWSSRGSAEKSSPLKDTCTPARDNGQIFVRELAPNLNGSVGQGTNKNVTENGHVKEQAHPAKSSQKQNGVHENHSTEKVDSYIPLTGHRAGEAAIVYEHGADIEALMPKLRHSDYYTEPRIQELAAKERAEPGFCRRVRDFVVGRNGYGSIKFLGETDVRRLDLENIVQFNNREVIVYSDEDKKPPVGQGLNKPAEVTLLNIKCFDKKTGQQCIEGPKVEKFSEMLRKKAQDQGAEFVSYEASKGEWKFRVDHFSRYRLDDDDGTDYCGVNLDVLGISSC